MKNHKHFFLISVSFLLAACVTINVYFPAAAAEDAAGKFIDQVFGDEPVSGDSSASLAPTININPLTWIIPAAHAAADINVSTPEIKKIQARMAQRFSTALKAYFANGSIGLSQQGLIRIRDVKSVPLAERQKLKKWVSDENRDRNAVYREIAVANGKPEWEADIRKTFSKQWINRAKKGWYYQNSAGQWLQK